MQTWVYRVAHNVGASHVADSRRLASRLVDLDTVAEEVAAPTAKVQSDRQLSSTLLLELVRRLRPLDRQVILLYLEGEPATAIAEVTGLSAINVATKIHRIKQALRQQYVEEDANVRT